MVDSELISSASIDKKLKSVSGHKQGKEGPITYSKSCSLKNIVFGVWFRLKGGKQESKVIALLKHLSKLTNLFSSILFVLTDNTGS